MDKRSTGLDLFYNNTFRALFYQFVLFLVISAIAYYLYENVSYNLRARHIATGFAFLARPAEFQIGESLISYSPADTYARALTVGLLNTLSVSACGIILSTIVGIAMGVARVSTNWLLSHLATAYVEVVRNVPAILQVMFCAMVLQHLPVVRNAIKLSGMGLLSNRGLSIAVPAATPVHFWMAIGAISGLVAAAGFSRWARHRRDLTGKNIETAPIAIMLMAGIPLAIWILGGTPLTMSVPAIHGFGVVGGITLSPEFVAVLLGISAYASGFIAEIVRAGIQSTPKGQIEAARSIGLKPWFTMSHIVIPQAMRVIIPPLTSQYVSLIKNSSIAVVVGYSDLVNVGNTMMDQTGEAIEAIAVMMAVYLIVSVSMSLLMNFYNRIVAIKER